MPYRLASHCRNILSFSTGACNIWFDSKICLMVLNRSVCNCVQLFLTSLSFLRLSMGSATLDSIGQKSRRCDITPMMDRTCFAFLGMGHSSMLDRRRMSIFWMPGPTTKPNRKTDVWNQEHLQTFMRKLTAVNRLITRLMSLTWLSSHTLCRTQSSI